MNLEKALEMGFEVMTKYGLIETWDFKFDGAKRRFGLCNYRNHTISLSMHLVSLNNEKEVMATILHEVAHALVGPNHGHNFLWQAKAIELGCNGTRCYSKEVITPPRKAIGVCPVCGHTAHRHRMPRKLNSCGKCDPIKFNPKFQLMWSRLR